ncbi:hypothetical protein BRC83_02580, partial [Halobacteriales archaeon QS_1_68_17]
MSEDPVDELAAAHEARERARERVAAVGEDTLRAVADAHEELTALFDRYETRATGDGDFAVFIEFQEKLAKFVERLPEDHRHREAFEEVDDVLQQRRLTESDFAAARETLAPVRDDVARLDDRDAAEKRYERARSAVRRRLSELDDRIDDLERLQSLGEADLDAPVERLRDPVEAYDEAVREAFGSFKREKSARTVLGFVEATGAYPLVPYRDPPADLREYVVTHPPGTEPIPVLLEYSEYSRSKLDHYVDDPGALRRNVSTHQTYLRRLDTDPLTVGWPPPPADALRWRVRELVAVTGRFAPEPVVDRARELRDLAHDREIYRRLRESALARDELGPEERARLERGAVERDLRARRAER